VEWREHRDKVLKEYGFTMDDYYKMCNLTDSNTKVRCDESVRTFKEKQKIKLDKKLDECEIQ
jgi:DNA-binding transcriptional MerR regulator